jgi:protein-tyrosine-phosphatase
MTSTVLFLCPYGGAKSVIAASAFNRLAQDLGLPFVGVAASADVPYDAVPPGVVDYLAKDGVDVRAFRPRRVEAADLDAAAKVISIDCDLSMIDTRAVQIERWDEVPKVSDGIDASAEAIRRHVAVLIDQLR